MAIAIFLYGNFPGDPQADVMHKPWNWRISWECEFIHLWATPTRRSGELIQVMWIFLSSSSRSSSSSSVIEAESGEVNFQLAFPRLWVAAGQAGGGEVPPPTWLSETYFPHHLFLFHQAGQGGRLGEEFPLTVERRMISSSLGEADDWLTRFRNEHSLHHIVQFQRYDVNVLSISPAKKFCLRVFEIIFNLKNCKRNQIQLGSCYVCTLALATKIPRERASNLKLVND